MLLEDSSKRRRKRRPPGKDKSTQNAGRKLKPNIDEISDMDIPLQKERLKYLELWAHHVAARRNAENYYTE